MIGNNAVLHVHMYMLMQIHKLGIFEPSSRWAQFSVITGIYQGWIEGGAIVSLKQGSSSLPEAI